MAAPDHCGAATWPLVCEKQRLPRKVFRRSIAWLLDWLSTLRSAGCPHPAQDSLPAAGQALPDGRPTRKIPLKGFRVVSLHLIPLSQASCRNHIDRPQSPSHRGVSDRSTLTVVVHLSSNVRLWPGQRPGSLGKPWQMASQGFESTDHLVRVPLPVKQIWRHGEIHANVESSSAVRICRVNARDRTENPSRPPLRRHEE